MLVDYHFKALDEGGKPIEGERKADSRGALIEALKAEGLTILHIADAEGEKTGRTQQGHKFEPFGISREVVAFFTRQLAELTEAGVPVVQCITSLQRFTPSSRFQEVLQSVSADIQRGQGLHQAMAGHPEVFSNVYLSMIKVGEASGNLPGLVARLADYLDRDLELRGKIRSALTYPVFILIFSMILVYAMVAYLLPGFEPIWNQSGLDLRHYPITLFLLKLSAMTHSFWDELFVAVICGGLLYGFWKFANTPEGSKAVDSFVYRLPVLSSFVQLTIMARSANTLGTLVNSGVPLVEGLELAARTAGNQVVTEAVEEVSRKVQQGSGLSAAFAETEVFPPLMIQMVSIGEEAGDLGKMLGRVAHYYQRQLDSAIKSFSSLIEPVTMIFVGGIVFVFVLGVFMPIMGIVGALQSQM